MKKLSLLAVVTAMAASAFALPSYVEFSSTGPDKYADGTDVIDGEIYALVWVKTGATFEGFAADGGLVNSEANKLIGAAPLAKDGRCKTVIFLLDGANAELPGKGEFSVYLLDTRVKTTAADGTVKTTLAGVKSGAFAAVNGYTAAVQTPVEAGEAVTAGAVAGAGMVSALPKDAPKPVVKAIQVVDGKVIVTVANTVPYLQYGISSGDTLTNMSKNELVGGVNGTADGEITLVVDDPKNNRFFKVIRK